MELRERYLARHNVVTFDNFSTFYMIEPLSRQLSTLPRSGSVAEGASDLGDHASRFGLDLGREEAYRGGGEGSSVGALPALAGDPAAGGGDGWVLGWEPGGAGGWRV